MSLSNPEMHDPLSLAEALITCPSVTPATGAVFNVLEAALLPLGFAVDRWVMGEAPDGPVENLIAVRTNGTGRHFAFAGHLDVVPPGSGWSSDPFVPERRGALLHGRGAVDMKGSIASFVAALPQCLELPGTLSLLITGDEEGAAVYGTRAIMERMAARGIQPDLCLVGEPTSVNRLGDMVKIGAAWLGQYVDRCAGHAGPCRLSPPGRQSDPAPAAYPLRNRSDHARRRQ
jgi:succinyl-diaminopimelate desuccinylase